ncbi:putative Glycosyltransferase WbuB [Rubrivivax sp. A210]|nr:putative Glycosyltransferase WbuB [Rubrivivax sp. A210]
MVEAFRTLGHEVEVDCLAGCDPTRPPATEPAAGSAPAGLSRRLLAAVSARAPQWLFGVFEVLYNLPLALRLLPKLLLRRPDLVYERYSLCTFVPALACRLLRIPHVLEVNDSVVIERSRPLALARTSRWFERRIVDWTCVIVTISEQFRRQMVEGLGLDAQRVLVCPNAVSRPRFVERQRLAPEARQALRERHGIATARVIGSAGQFVAWHGLPRFLAAAADCIRRRDLYVLFIGDGPTRQETLDVARQHGIADRVRFTGMVSLAAVPDHLELLDIAIIPFSNIHGSPMKLMEFMAMRLPVLAPALPPILEVLVDGETGFIFPRDDMAAMVATLERVLDDGAALARVGRNAQEHVVRHLTWDAHAERVLRHLGLCGR